MNISEPPPLPPQPGGPREAGPIQQASTPPTNTNSPAQQGYYYTQEGFPDISGPQSRAEARWWAGSRLCLRAEALPLLTRPRPSPRHTHRWVPDTAGEGHPAALPAGVQVSAVEVDIEVPVVGPSGSAARPLGGGRRARVSQAHPRSPILFGDRPRLAGSGLETASQVGTSPQTGRAWAQGHQSSSRLLTRLMEARDSGKGLLSLSP